MMISLIVPTYKRVEELRATIDSILGQTYKDFELIIVDDGSPQDMYDQIKPLVTDSRVTLHRLTTNSGVDQARNEGLKYAGGKYVIFFDSDDILWPDTLQHFVESIEADSKIDAVMAPYTTSEGELTGFARPDGLFPFEDLLCQKNVRRLKPCVIMMRRELVGDLRFVAPHTDFIFYRRVLQRAGHIQYLAEPCATYTTNPGPARLSISRRTARSSATTIRMSVAIADFLDEFEKPLAEHCGGRIASYAYGAASGFARAGQTKKVRQYALKGLHSQFQLRLALLLVLSYLPGYHVLVRGLLRVFRTK